ncbi:MAG: antitoxin [Acidobacteria bacterium]|nr:antitoxin [Acidobacteriota bacterium]
MQTKLTLRMDKELVKKAKTEARRRGKSISRMTAEFIEALDRRNVPKTDLPPITRSLLGVLKGRRLSERDHKQHLKDRHL